MKKVLRVNSEFLQDIYALHGYTPVYLNERISELMGELVELNLVNSSTHDYLKDGLFEVIDVYVDLGGNIFINPMILSKKKGI